MDDKLLEYFLLEWFDEAYSRGGFGEEPTMPKDLDKEMKELKEYIKYNTGIDVDEWHKECKEESDDDDWSRRDSYVKLLREDSKYWHQMDEEHYFKMFERVSNPKVDFHMGKIEPKD